MRKNAVLVLFSALRHKARFAACLIFNDSCSSKTAALPRATHGLPKHFVSQPPVGAARRARAADAQALAALARAAYAVHVPRIGREPGPMLDDYAARIADDIVHVIEDEHGVAALLVLIEKPAGMLLDNLAVAPRAQGHGLGRALIELAEHLARERGHRHLDLYTHVLMTANIALYARHGYEQTRRVTEHGFERVYMRKLLV